MEPRLSMVLVLLIPQDQVDTSFQLAGDSSNSISQSECHGTGMTGARARIRRWQSFWLEAAKVVAI